jgi:hypothetical protein
MAGQILRVRRVIRLDAFGLWSAGRGRSCLPLAFGLQYPRATGLSETALRLRRVERELVAWSLCKACLDVEFASIMSLERISRARVHSSG